MKFISYVVMLIQDTWTLISKYILKNMGTFLSISYEYFQNSLRQSTKTSTLYNIIVSSHMWLLNTWKEANETKKLDFWIYLVCILILILKVKYFKMWYESSVCELNVHKFTIQNEMYSIWQIRHHILKTL